MVTQWEAALQRIADSLDTSEQRLHRLSDPETLRPQLPQLLALDDPMPLPPGTRIALLVHHPDELTTGDVAVVTHLATRGVPVNLIGTHEASPHDPALVAASHDLLLLSASVRLLDTATRYTQTTTPLIFWEPLLLATTHLPLTPWGGTRPEQTDIRIVDTAHPITAGLSTGHRLRVVRQPDTLSVAYPPSAPRRAGAGTTPDRGRRGPHGRRGRRRVGTGTIGESPDRLLVRAAQHLPPEHGQCPAPL